MSDRVGSTGEFINLSADPIFVEKGEGGEFPMLGNQLRWMFLFFPSIGTGYAGF